MSLSIFEFNIWIIWNQINLKICITNMISIQIFIIFFFTSAAVQGLKPKGTPEDYKQTKTYKLLSQELIWHKTETCIFWL